MPSTEAGADAVKPRKILRPILDDEREMLGELDRLLTEAREAAHGDCYVELMTTIAAAFSLAKRVRVLKASRRVSRPRLLQARVAQLLAARGVRVER